LNSTTKNFLESVANEYR